MTIDVKDQQPTLHGLKAHVKMYAICAGCQTCLSDPPDARPHYIAVEDITEKYASMLAAPTTGLKILTEEAYDALVKDAARYRWLRDSSIYSAPAGSLIELWLFNRPTATAMSFDIAIDAAITTATQEAT